MTQSIDPGTTLRIAPLTLAILALTIHPPPLPAQPLDEVFEDTTQVVEVRVPVNVTTRDGEPVRGLTAADFKIFDDNKLQEITDFRVVDLDVLEPGGTRTEIERSVPAAARRHILLLFDLSFSTPAAIVRARLAARDFVLEELHPTDLVAVAMHTVEGGGRMLVTFTPDRAQVARAIDTLGAPRLLQLARRDPLRFLIEDPSIAGLEASSDIPNLASERSLASQQDVIGHLSVIAKGIERMEKSFLRGRISSWSASMADLARFMDSVQGRKQVVYFSEGFDGRLLFGRKPSGDDREYQEDLFNLQFGNTWLVDTDDIYGHGGLQSQIASTLEEFRRADCVIQAVDISGLAAGTGAELRARDVGQDALFYLANETGGALFENANDFGSQLGSMLQRSAVTYLLTFRPEDLEPDGSYHRIRVRADLPRGAKLSFRQGYYAPRPYDQLHPLEKSLLASDAIASAAPVADLPVHLLVAPFRAGETSSYVPVIIEVSGSELVAGLAGDQLPVEIYAYASDARGEMKDFFTQLVTLDLSSGREALAETGLKYYGHLDLAPGDYLVRVLVRSGATGRSGVETAELSIPAYQQADPVLLPPFFVEQGRQWFLVRETQQQASQRSVVYPFTVNGEPYIPSARPALSTRDEARVCLVAYNLGEGELLLDSRVLASDGREIEEGSLALVERTITGIEGLDKLIAVFRPRELEAGEYTLRVALRNLSTGAIESNSIPFTYRLD